MHTIEMYATVKHLQQRVFEYSLVDAIGLYPAPPPPVHQNGLFKIQNIEWPKEYVSSMDMGLRCSVVNGHLPGAASLAPVLRALL